MTLRDTVSVNFNSVKIAVTFTNSYYLQMTRSDHCEDTVTMAINHDRSRWEIEDGIQVNWYCFQDVSTKLGNRQHILPVT